MTAIKNATWKIKWLVFVFLLLFFFVLGYSVCLFTNGYGKLAVALDATSSDEGRILQSKLAELAGSSRTASVAELLGYTPEEVCLQHPYMTEKAFRERLKANTLRFRMIGDDVNRLWIVRDSIFVKTIDVPRSSVAELTVRDASKRCMQGKDARLVSSGNPGKKEAINLE